jgi:hypothetical protein
LASFIGAVSITFIAGPAFMLWYLRKRGYHSSEITAALGVNIIVIGMFSAIWQLYAIPTATAYLQQIENGMTYFNAEVITIMAW